MNPNAPQREAIQASDNPIGMDGIEFIEYATSKPQALGQVLEMMGFRPIARHRSREVMLYRQGGVNLIVNAHHSVHSQSTAPDEQPVIAAMALRVRDAAVAYQRALDLGAWAVPTRVEVMELNIPAIHGVGQSRIYFVDRHRVFWRSPNGVFGVSIPINGQPASVGNGSTLGFACTSPEQVNAWHAAGVAHGGTSCEDPPGIRQGAAGQLYLAYLRDPDGNKLCATYRYPKA